MTSLSFAGFAIVAKEFPNSQFLVRERAKSNPTLHRRPESLATLSKLQPTSILQKFGSSAPLHVVGGTHASRFRMSALAGYILWLDRDSPSLRPFNFQDLSIYARKTEWKEGPTPTYTFVSMSIYSVSRSRAIPIQVPPVPSTLQDLSGIKFVITQFGRLRLSLGIHRILRGIKECVCT
ncbi:hypothetical protein JR316_0000299 [Psilocybe cubensis]|uniref:Uncharacterized protein n=1 Tax=Psilocybe cubensis TaxID=181762 RepID=A0ACB8HE08_PSICU|nr:hypothetical protein JR316_0000299 [Psilocybe cubensis]KAH9486235.1 hypothetical protein JR316_0000299 [Psilocybe cubensis]